jgi:hypothetical protein
MPPDGPQGCRPGGHWHVPAMHCLPPVQTSPHAPQLATVPSLIGRQIPPMSQQRNPAGTWSPHARQLASVHRFVHTPLQHIWLDPQQATGSSGVPPHGWAPGMGTQAPFWQLSHALQLRQRPVLGSAQTWHDPHVETHRC